MSRFLGETISDTVYRQILKRAEVSKRSAGRTTEDLLYLNSNTSWVRAISLVDVKNNDDNSFSSDLAKKYVLGSTFLTYQNNTFKKREGLNFDEYDTVSSYSNTQYLGIRPTGGITGFSIKSKNRFGTIRVAEISFNVWSTEEFNAVEKLYFRPGFWCLIEWGNALYLDNDEEGLQTYTDDSKIYDEVFTTSINFKNLRDQLNRRKLNLQGNYDYSLGLITNFGWTLREDGGFDCKLSVISPGAILESLKINIPTVTSGLFANTLVSLGLVDKHKTSQITKSPIHYLVYSLQQFFSLNKERSTATYSSLSTSFKRFADYGITDENILGVCKRFSTISDFFGGNERVYVPLRVVLASINAGMLPKDASTEGETNSYPILFDLKTEVPYTTFNYHFSLNPTIAVLPKITPAPYFFTNISEFSQVPTSTDLLDILISGDTLIELADSFSTGGSSNELNVLGYLRAVLGEVQTALGNVNEFDVFIDQDNGTASIVDYSFSVRFVENPANIKILPLLGLGSTVRQVELSSKLASSLSNQLAVAAGNAADGNIEDVTGLLEYNLNVQSRILSEPKNQAEVLTPDNRKNTKIQFILDLMRAYALFTGDFGVYNYFKPTEEVLIQATEENNLFTKVSRWFSQQARNVENIISDVIDGKIDPETWETIIPRGSVYYQNFKKFNGTVPGIIPIQANITLSGLAGLKIGQVFFINDEALPEKYKEYGLIITGLDHSIEDNYWSTVIATQTVFLKPGKRKYDTGIVSSLDILTENDLNPDEFSVTTVKESAET